MLSGKGRKLSGCRLFCLSLLASSFVTEGPESWGKSTVGLTLLAWFPSAKAFIGKWKLPRNLNRGPRFLSKKLCYTYLLLLLKPYRHVSSFWSLSLMLSRKLLKSNHDIDKWESVLISTWLCSKNMGLCLSRICKPKGINLLFAYRFCLFPFLYSWRFPPLPFHDQPIPFSYSKTLLCQRRLIETGSV